MKRHLLGRDLFFQVPTLQRTGGWGREERVPAMQHSEAWALDHLVLALTVPTPPSLCPPP